MVENLRVFELVLEWDCYVSLKDTQRRIPRLDDMEHYSPIDLGCLAEALRLQKKRMG